MRAEALGPFDERSRAALLEGVRGTGTAAEREGSPGAPAADEVFAAAVWSTLTEPGDAAAGILRLVWGPSGALEALDLTGDEVAKRLREQGVFDAARFDFSAARARWQPRVSEQLIRATLRSASVLGIRLVVPGDREWPTGFDDLGVHAPAALWVRGDPGALTRSPGVALVGCRAASSYGELVAAELADGLVSRGLAVHSGGAYGIDGMAHRATLAADGATVAVMAGGVDRYYPSGNHDLLQRVAENGAVVSEMPCGTAPSRWRFLQRNRLIAALSAGTVVVEAGHRSGASNTAGHARSLDRPVGAVPGPISSPASAGCHRLIREGQAVCITSAADVLEMIEPGLDVDQPGIDRSGGTSHEVRLLDALSSRRGQSDVELAISSGLSPGVVRGTLSLLEAADRAVERETGWFRVER
ncbi:DNA-processing protein DprA [Frondihabitans cladoniiphilus]|uniref:DNA-processing protein DprA n=1 Tax=Frondihabitans cladoniiphilus TaxID=715785 RepID=A0ABP8VIM1_9MICO